MKERKKLELVRQVAVSEYLATIGARGGKAKVPKGTAMLSDAEKRERGKKAAAARWAAVKKKAAGKKKPKPPVV